MDVRVDQVDQQVIENADRIFRDQQFRLHARTDRLFAALMVLQWIGGVIAALILSPGTSTPSSTALAGTPPLSPSIPSSSSMC